jgi:coproporphyrinogen III oxidase
MGKAVIDAYIGIVMQAIQYYTTYTAEEKATQLDYHTLYLFQVLTLDRGTTSGLLIHDQNDVGIMGSIPSHINRTMLERWKELIPKPQDELVQVLLEALPSEVPTPVEVETKKALAEAVRAHYKKYPEALSMQASGAVILDTVNNHS